MRSRLSTFVLVNTGEGGYARVQERSASRGAAVVTADYWTTGPGGDQPDEWQALLSATHLPWRVDVPASHREGRFHAWARRWWIDDLALVDCGCGPCSGSRRRTELAATDGAFVVVLFTLGGRETVEQAGRQANLHAGDAVVWDSGRTARFAVWSPLTKRSLLIPRAALDEIGGRAQVSAGVMLDGRSPPVRLLRTYLDTLRQALPELDAPAVVAARNATLELLVGALRGDDDVPVGGSSGPALRAAMDRWIQRHLLGDAVTPAAVARAHGVSVRTVNRVFNTTGDTLGSVVRVRRLARAREELTRTSTSITSIAHRWGFADGSHFSRSFKALYGCSPSDYRAGAS